MNPDRLKPHGNLEWRIEGVAQNFQRGVKSMTKPFPSGLPIALAGLYAAIVIFLLFVAMVTTDEFGFRFIPAIEATYPLSGVLYPSSNILVSIIVGGAVNTLLLFGLLKAAALLVLSRAPK